MTLVDVGWPGCESTGVLYFESRITKNGVACKHSQLFYSTRLTVASPATRAIWSKIRKERSVECVFGCYWCAVAAYGRPIPVTGVDVSKGQLWLSIPGSSLIDTYYNRKKQLTNHPIPGAHTDFPIPATGLIPADSVDVLIPVTGLIVLPLGERYTNPQGTDRSPQARS